jgi:predicted RNA-binding Zn ribbon-like protein
MHWVEVDGYPLPKRIGGHPAVDFCDTWSGWNGPVRWSPGMPPDRRREWLRDYDRFAVWSGYVGLLSPPDVEQIRSAGRTARPQASRVLARAHRVREALYRLLLDPDDREAFTAVAGVAQAAVRTTVLQAAPDGQVRRVLPVSVGLALPLLAVARAAEDLLAGPLRDQVRVCPGDDCGWLFIDQRGRRRWCDMSSCGNRAKVRTHAARRRT